MSSMTLSIDCGGLFIKSCVLDESGTMHAAPTRVETPYPLSTERFLDTVEKIAKSLPKAQRVTVGLPGMIRNGVVVATPHYINDAGPHTRMNPEMCWLSLVTNSSNLPGFTSIATKRKTLLTG